MPIFEKLRALESERNAKLSHPLFDHLPNKAPINVGVVRAGGGPCPCWVDLLPGEELGPVRSLVLDRIVYAAGRDPWHEENPPKIEFFAG